jgi:hypothetical protein
LSVPSLFDPLTDFEIFNDEFFWSLPQEMYHDQQHNGHDKVRRSYDRGLDVMI